KSISYPIVEVKGIKLINRPLLAMFIERHTPSIGVNSRNDPRRSGKQRVLRDVVIDEINRQLIRLWNACLRSDHEKTGRRAATRMRLGVHTCHSSKCHSAQAGSCQTNPSNTHLFSSV